MEQVISKNESVMDKIFKKIVFMTLSNIKRGRLSLVYNSEVLTYGEGEEVIHVEIHSPIFFRRLVLSGEVGLGEAFIKGEWSSSNLKGFLSLLILNQESLGDSSAIKDTGKIIGINILGFLNKVEHYLNHNSLENSKKNISHHYDLSNNFYKLMLDETMTYSSALFTQAEQTLREAQYSKYESIASMLKIEDGESVLEIGSGWGGMSKYLTSNYKVDVDTYTISKNQFDYVQEMIKNENLKNINIHFKDYREPKGTFDRVVSIEMIEAVGDKYLDTYFSEVAKSLKKNGRFAMQAILMPSSRYENYKKSSDWIEKYIFAGGHLPSIERLVGAASKVGLELIDFKEFGTSYAETLKQWNLRFQNNLDEVKRLGFDEEFVRMWTYYLEICEAAFDTRNIYLAQLCFSRPNN